MKGILLIVFLSTSPLRKYRDEEYSVMQNNFATAWKFLL